MVECPKCGAKAERIGEDDISTHYRCANGHEFIAIPIGIAHMYDFYK